MPQANFRLNARDRKRIGSVTRYLANIHVPLDRVMDTTSQQAKVYAQKKVRQLDAYDTGRLHDNIKVAKLGVNNYVVSSEAYDPETGEEYATTVHDGLAKTGKNSVARPYLTLAAKFFRNKFERTVRAIFRDLSLIRGN